MAYDFFNGLFNLSEQVRLKKSANGIVKLEESQTVDAGVLSKRSYVEIALPSGFAIRHGENFRLKNIFSAAKGYGCNSDFIIVSNESPILEIYIVELKSRNYRKPKVINQLICGSALVSYCVRFGIDKVQSSGRFKYIRAYGVVLTNTTSECLGTGLSANSEVVEFAKKCGPSSSVYCVNGHEITLEQLRYHAIPIALDNQKANDFTGLPPYPGTGD